MQVSGSPEIPNKCIKDVVYIPFKVEILTVSRDCSSIWDPRPFLKSIMLDNLHEIIIMYILFCHSNVSKQVPIYVGC